MKPRLALLILVLPLLTSCGLKKGLDRPPPLFGAERARYESELARQKAEQEANKKKPKPPGGDTAAPPAPEAPPIFSGPLAPPPAPGNSGNIP